MRDRPLILLPRARQGGFTLIELLVVMGILVILTVIALPVFNYITGARSVESGINLTAAVIGRARTLSLSRPDNKYIGVLFYTDPENDRDAIQIVEVRPEEDTTTVGTSTGPERYFSWQLTANYRTESTDPLDPYPADAVYAQSIDPLNDSNSTATFQNRPVIKRYTARQNSQGAQPPGGAVGFQNNFWGNTTPGNTVPITLDAEVQYLPRGVRARVLKKDGSVARPGLILFDKRGHLTQQPWGIGADNDSSVDGGEKLLEAMGLDVNKGLPISKTRSGGIVITLFNDSDITTGSAKDQTVVDTWAKTQAVQYGVGPESGEMISGTTITPAE